MSDSILANIQQEGALAFPENSGEQEKETPAESPTEDNQTEQSPSSQGEGEIDASSEEGAPKEPNTENANNLPFNKDPRWQDLIRERDEAREEASRLRSATPEPVAQVTLQATQASVPKPFVELFGENEDAWNKWQELSRLERETLKNELVQDQVRAQEAQKSETDRWNKWVEKSVEGLERTHGAKLQKDSSDFNELMKITLEYKPSDDHGNISFEKGYELMMKLRREENQEKSKARKSIAAATSSEPKAEAAPADFYTSKDLRRGWNLLK